MTEYLYKREHAAVRYEHPSRHQPDKCASCARFIAPNACQNVKSPVRPEDWCLRFKPKAEKNDNERDFHEER